MMNTFKEFIGYDLHTSRAAFEHQGVEIVFIHDFFILKRRVYINGEQVFSRHSQWLGFCTDAELTHEDKRYRIVSFTRSLLSFKQDVTVWVDGIEIGRKVDPFYAALSWQKKLHAVLGVMGVGFIAGFLAAVIA